MKTKLWYSMVMVVVTSIYAHAQTYLEAGYSGATIFHPGVNASYRQVIHARDNQKRNTRQELVAGLQVGFYFHKNRHTGVYISPVIEWIKTTRKGFQYGLDLPLGYLRTFIPKVYELKENGDIDRLRFAGTNHLVVSPALRLGHRFSDESFINAWYIRNRLMMITPYAGGLATQYFAEVGVVKKMK